MARHAVSGAVERRGKAPVRDHVTDRLTRVRDRRPRRSGCGRAPAPHPGRGSVRRDGAFPAARTAARRTCRSLDALPASRKTPRSRRMSSPRRTIPRTAPSVKPAHRRSAVVHKPCCAAARASSRARSSGPAPAAAMRDILPTGCDTSPRASFFVIESFLAERFDHKERRLEAVVSQMRRLRSMAAVAPQTMSPSSSKKWTGCSSGARPHRSSW